MQGSTHCATGQASAPRNHERICVCTWAAGIQRMVRDAGAWKQRQTRDGPTRLDEGGLGFETSWPWGLEGFGQLCQTVDTTPAWGQPHVSDASSVPKRPTRARWRPGEPVRQGCRVACLVPFKLRQKKYADARHQPGSTPSGLGGDVDNVPAWNGPIHRCKPRSPMSCLDANLQC